MIEIKLTNGDYVRNKDNEQFAKWIVDIATDISLGKISEKQLAQWMNETPEIVIPVPRWADMFMKRFGRRE